MEIIFDIVIFLIIIFNLYIGYKKGIVNVGVKLISIIVSILASIILCAPLTNIVINNTQIDEKIEEIVVKNFSSNPENVTDGENDLSKYIQNYTMNIVQDTQNTVVQNVAKSIAINVIRAGVLFVIFVLIRVVFIVLQIFTDVLTRIPIIKQLNEFGGIIYALLKSIVIIYIILAILLFVSTMSGSVNLISVIENTFITKWFYNLMF